MGSSVASRESSPRFVREGNPVIAERNESEESQIEAHELTDDVSSASKLAEVLEFIWLDAGGTESP